MSEIENILEEIRFKAGIYRDQKRRNEAYNDENYNCYMILNYIEEKDKEIKKLHSIIKEVRKYIKENEKEYGSLEDNEKIILEILDKENI